MEYFLDSFIHILGPFISLSSSSKVAIPINDIISPTGTIVREGYPVTRPTTSLSSVLYLSFITTPAGTAEGTGMKWIIAGTEGQVIIETHQIDSGR